MPCLHDASKLQLNAVDDESLEMLSREYGYEGEQLAGLKSLRSQHMMSAAEVREHLTTTNPAMSRLFEVWDTSFLKNLTLTSVGIAIGHANARRMTKDYDAELAIWVN